MGKIREEKRFVRFIRRGLAEKIGVTKIARLWSEENPSQAVAHSAVSYYIDKHSLRGVTVHRPSSQHITKENQRDTGEGLLPEHEIRRRYIDERKELMIELGRAGRAARKPMKVYPDVFSPQVFSEVCEL